MLEQPVAPLSTEFLMNHTSELVLCIDLNGRIIDVSPPLETLLDTPKTNIINKSWEQFIGPLHLDFLKTQSIITLLTDLPTHPVECSYTGINSNQYVLWSFIPLVTAEKKNDRIDAAGKRYHYI
jgi:PAS domain-containing protein